MFKKRQKKTGVPKNAKKRRINHKKNTAKNKGDLIK